MHRSESKRLADPIVPRQYLVHFTLLVLCFMLWGMLNNMTDNLVPAFGKIFMMKAVDSSYVQVAFYGAYGVLAIPAALIIRRYSYRAGVLLGLGMYIVGAAGYIPAAMTQNYSLFLVSIFILAGGLSILETTCNPFVISLGSEETSVRRLNFAQAFNPIGSLAGILAAKFLILGNLNPATYEERIAMEPAALKQIQSAELVWVCVPYVALIIWVFFFRDKSRERDQETLNFLPSLKRLLSIPRYYWGVITQFFYVGVQISVWTWTTQYIMTNLGLNEAQAVVYYIISIVVFIISRWICTALMRIVDSGTLMAYFAVGGILASLGAVYLSTAYSVWCVVLISAFMSLMFPTIYGIALKGLGSELKLGAAGLIMAILGGAVLPAVMGGFIDNGTLSGLTPAYSGQTANVRSAFLLPVVCFVVVLLYALRFRKGHDAK